MNSKKELVSILNYILNKYNLKQIDLARQLEVTPQFINSVFKQRKTLSIHHIEIMREKLNLSYSDVIQLKKAVIFHKDVELMEWMQKLEKISTDEKNKEIIEALFKIQKLETKESILDFILYKLSNEASL